MCGIFCVSGSTDAGRDVLGGLKRLEYRGYDSWGVAITHTDTPPTIQKQVGKISDAHVAFEKSVCGIGHTRWATHGTVTQTNAHPHHAGLVTLVHNGILENYVVLRDQLKKRYTFMSDTDSEVFATLIAEKYRIAKNPVRALSMAMKEAEGRFAIAVLFDDDTRLFAARRGSPLIVGRGKRTTYLSSDIPALLPHTHDIEFLEDDEIAIAEGASITYRNAKNGRAVIKKTIRARFEKDTANKGAYAHFMQKEIFDQKKTIAAAGRAASLPRLAEATRLITNAKRMYLIGSGTANKACMTGQYYFALHAQKEVIVIPPAEMDSFVQFLNKDALVCVVSQSGETADVLEPLEKAKKAGASIVVITNVPSSSIARMADIHIDIFAGAERAVASTKALTAQMAILYLLAHAASARGKKQETAIRRARTHLQSATRKIQGWLTQKQSDAIARMAVPLAKHRDLFIIGRNTFYPIALEAAIKIQEVSYIHAQGFAAGELKHGPIALITKGTPVIVLGNDSATLSNAIEARSRGAHIIGIAPKQAEVFDEYIYVPDCDELQSIATVIPIQLLAYHLATTKKLDPDKPRNLAKSVTVK